MKKTYSKFIILFLFMNGCFEHQDNKNNYCKELKDFCLDKNNQCLFINVEGISYMTNDECRKILATQID